MEDPATIANRLASQNADPFFAGCDRTLRRKIFADEKRERLSGKWSFWQTISTPHGYADNLHPLGWTHDIHTVYKNTWLVVMVRDCKTAWGIVKHASIVTAMRAELHWKEKMRVKEELFGIDAAAIEVFPPRDSVVDVANVYHLWILPANAALPFGISKHDPCSERHYRPEATGRIYP